MNSRIVRRIVLLAIAILSVGVTGEAPYTQGDYALSDSRPQSCQTIIETSRVYGTCCSLNTTASGGCIVNIKNGWCRIVGQYWAGTWNSTDDKLTCDPSEWEINYGVAIDTLAPTPTKSAATNFPLASLAAFSVAVFAFL